MTEWYGPIKVDGKRPAWLADDDRVRWWYDDKGAYREVTACTLNWKGECSWRVKSIKIPVDHWAVAPLKAGYEPWAGGENAPDDWDGEGVYYRDGTTEGGSYSPFYWSKYQGNEEAGDCDIIGYRKRKDEGHGEKPNAATSREDVIREKVVRELVEFIREMGGNSYAIEIERHMLPMSDVERMAREMHAQSADDVIPWELLVDTTRTRWIKTAKWAIEHGARLEK